MAARSFSAQGAQEPRVAQTRQHAIVRSMLKKGQLKPLATIALLGMVTACQPEPASEDVPERPENTASPRPPLPVAEAPLDRATLLLAVAKASSAAALGRDDTADQRTLDGKRFEVRIRFGCRDSGRQLAPGAGPFSVRYDSSDRTLRVRASPDVTIDDPRIKRLADNSIEAVEGFWMRRPWLLADGCPVVPTPSEPDKTGAGESSSGQEETSAEAISKPQTSHRVGLAQFYTEADSRTSRRGDRPYETTKVLSEKEQPSPSGYNLVLSGRLRELNAGRVILCRNESANEPPECLVSVDFDRVWIEKPGSREVLAEWAS